MVLTGDVHRNWANDVKVDYKHPASPVVDSELVCTSIGNGTGSTVDPVMPWNPHLKFYNDNLGYVNTTITKDALTADFRVLDYVTTPGSPVSTKASFAIQDGVPGLISVVKPVATMGWSMRKRPTVEPAGLGLKNLRDGMDGGIRLP
ncbi:MAG: alkaline phosphatase [Thermoleophilia bacterium]|nr:alkaline phosphatase [Thermoleophilia bacterium]